MSTIKRLRLIFPKWRTKSTSTKLLGKEPGRHSGHFQLDNHRRLVTQITRLAELIQQLHLTIHKWRKKYILKKLLQPGKEPGRHGHPRTTSNPKQNHDAAQ